MKYQFILYSFIVFILQGCIYNALFEPKPLSISEFDESSRKLYDEGSIKLAEQIAEYCIEDYNKYFIDNTSFIVEGNYSYHAYGRAYLFQIKSYTISNDVEDKINAVGIETSAIRIITQIGGIYAVRTGNENSYDIISENDLKKTIIRQIQSRFPRITYEKCTLPPGNYGNRFIADGVRTSYRGGFDSVNLSSKFLYKKIPTEYLNTSVNLDFSNLTEPTYMTDESVKQKKMMI